MESEHEQQALVLVAERLHDRFPDVDPQTIDGVVDGIHRRFDTSPVRDFLPILIEREAIDHFVHLPGQRTPSSV